VVTLETKKKYNLRLAGSVSVVAGAFLLVEHIYNFGFEPLDFVGHEWYGVILVSIGCVLGYLSRRVNNG